MENPPPTHPSPRRFGCLGIAIFVALCISVLFNFILILFSSAKVGTQFPAIRQKAPRFEEATVVDGARTSPDKIALIPLHGLISSAIDGSLGADMVDDIKIALQQAANDSNVKAVVLEINSPGGEVTASDVIYNAVREVREKKPVVVYMDALAASGGYYVACGGTHLIANETSLTGSIGVIIETLNYRNLIDKIGVDMVVFKSGKMKDMLSGSRPMTDEEKNYVQNLVMQMYEKFVGIVATERKLDVNALKNGVADGRVLTAKDALKEKLIDGLGQIETAYAKAKDLGHAPGAAVIRYESPFHLGRLLRFFGKVQPPKIEVKFPQEFSSPLQPGRLYLLPSTFAR